jgi:hypothetical protein
MCIIFLLGLLMTSAVDAAEESSAQNSIVTFWPLFDYRESPADDYSNLSILGPLIKIQHWKQTEDVAFRPLFYRSATNDNAAAETTYLYPVGQSDISRDVTRIQVLQLLQHNVYRKSEPEEREQESMLFPVYMSGTSEKYGPYTAFFPIYGNIYERFWKDEYHFILFPLYGKTVNKGTTSRNYLYPIFNTIEGENERGFHMWPLYGQAEKTGVYRKKFVLWPFYLSQDTGLDTDNPTSKLYMIPFYAASDSPKRTSRYYLWPFFGHVIDRGKNAEEWNYLWPLWRQVRGEQQNVDRFLPFFSHEEYKEHTKTWYMWPLYKHETDTSEQFAQERDRVLFFLYSDTLERWPKDGAERRRTALWPLYLYQMDRKGIKSVSLPAPIEPIIDRVGIERNWAPLWRIYQQKWNDSGDSAVSFLWNLYWHEVRGDDMAYEIFPFVSYQSEQGMSDLRLLKGLLRYRNHGDKRSVSLFGIPLGTYSGGAAEVPQSSARSNP